jgi:hypothetical protein
MKPDQAIAVTAASPKEPIERAWMMPIIDTDLATPAVQVVLQQDKAIFPCKPERRVFGEEIATGTRTT